MSVRVFFELSTSVVNPKYLGCSPFFESENHRLDTSPPSVLKAVYNCMFCTKRSLNTRIIGFCQPTLGQCIEDLKMEVRASTLIGDSSALQNVLARRRGEVEVDTLPWKPREEYIMWLRQQGRLAGDVRADE
ncbi:unnamed protein product [Phytomonas sp. Hart1]|nr:unnamed protein product [Phytomonas sp. Hart1]|eukprot:CCW69674.1 unnamed protein product [Phytomonas sp. isolate Hart1]